MAGQPKAGLVLFAALVAVSRVAAATQFAVDPEVGNNAFTAVFDSQIGERITAVSSAVGCTLTVDEAKREGRATCSVPLSSVRVDNDDTKTEHFGQWATNKKTDPKECTFQVEVPVVTLPSPVEPKTPVAFTTGVHLPGGGPSGDAPVPRRAEDSRRLHHRGAIHDLRTAPRRWPGGAHPGDGDLSARGHIRRKADAPHPGESR